MTETGGTFEPRVNTFCFIEKMIYLQVADRYTILII